MNVSGIMNTDIRTVKPDASLKTMLLLLACLPYRQLYVVDGSAKLLGIVSSFDLLGLMVPSYLDANLAKAVTADEAMFRRGYEQNIHKTAEEIMNRRFVALNQHDSLMEADALIKERGFNAMPVLDEAGKLVGEITRKSILSYLAFACCGLSCEIPKSDDQE